MLKIENSSKDKIKNIYFNNSNSSIFGLKKIEKFEDHKNTLSEAESKLLKVIMLKEHELLLSEPATLGCVEFLKSKKHLLDFENINYEKLISNKKFIMNGFNSIVECCNINYKTYEIFKNYLKVAGPGTRVEICVEPKILDYKIEKISKISLPLVCIFNNLKSFAKANIMIFRGQLIDANKLNKIFSWLKEKNEPLIILASNFSQEFLKQLEIKISFYNLKLCLLSPDSNNQMSEFSYYDLGYLSGAAQFDESPEFFLPEHCGVIFDVEINWESIKFNCDDENKTLLENKIKQDFSDLKNFSILPIIEKRISSISNNLVKIFIPEIFVINESAIIDELSSVISLWSKFIFEEHIKINEFHLQSFPANTIEKAINFLKSVEKIINDVEIII